MHSHNTGTYVQPYGHAVPTPHLQQLATEGVLFHNAFSTAPTCSPSRAGFLSGMHTHCTGLLGLSHRGFAMNLDYHIITTLKKHGYHTCLSGVEHVTADVRDNGYDEILSGANSSGWTADAIKDDPAASVVKFLQRPCDHEKPFFISMGLHETHTPFHPAKPDTYPAENANFCTAMSPFPDNEITRSVTADFKASARIMDDAFGRVLKAVDENGWRENTAIFCFTDHGLQIPRNICNLTDHGTRVFLIIRAPGAAANGQPCNAMVSLMDLAPTVYELAGIEIPRHVQGRPLSSHLNGNVESGREYVFSELNWHAAYEPMRCVRSHRYKYIRRYDNRDALVLPNTDDGVLKDFLLSAGWNDLPRAQEEFYDLVFDPAETNNLIDHSDYTERIKNLRDRLDEWMHETNDPLLATGNIAPPLGIRANDVDGMSPQDEPLLY